MERVNLLIARIKLSSQFSRKAADCRTTFLAQRILEEFPSIHGKILSLKSAKTLVIVCHLTAETSLVSVQVFSTTDQILGQLPSLSPTSIARPSRRVAVYEMRSLELRRTLLRMI